MGATTGPTPVDMTPEQFKDALDRYAPLIEAVSASKAGEDAHACFPPCIEFCRLTDRQPSPAKRRSQS